MKRLALILALLPSLAFAQDGKDSKRIGGRVVEYSIGGNLRHASASDDPDLPSLQGGIVFGVGAGYKWQSGVRLAIEATLRLQIGPQEEIATGAFMANTFYDFDTGTNWIPTLGGGLGALAGPRGSAFAYQGGGGIGYQVSDDPFILALEYRFLRAKSSSLEAKYSTFLLVGRQVF